jgi:hypothetical protein
MIIRAVASAWTDAWSNAMAMSGTGYAAFSRMAAARPDARRGSFVSELLFQGVFVDCAFEEMGATERGEEFVRTV